MLFFPPTTTLFVKKKDWHSRVSDVCLFVHSSPFVCMHVFVRTLLHLCACMCLCACSKHTCHSWQLCSLCQVLQVVWTRLWVSKCHQGATKGLLWSESKLAEDGGTLHSSCRSWRDLTPMFASWQQEYFRDCFRCVLNPEQNPFKSFT